MKESFLYILFSLTSILGYSQNQEAIKAFDSAFYHIAVNVSSSSPTKALHLADSLLTYSINDKQRLKSLMLKADILEKQERRGEAIKHAQQALQYAVNEKDYSFQARIYGFLSTQYRTIGFLDKGKESIKKGLSVSKKIQNKEQIIKYNAMANQELAEYAYEEKDYESAIEFLNLAIFSYEKEENIKFKNFFLGNCEELLGRIQIKLDNKQEALNHFSNANSYINKAEAGNTLWAALIYNGLGKMFLETESLDSANIYIRKALKISENGGHGSLRETVYSTTADYYKRINKLDSFSKYDAKFNAFLSSNTAKKKAMVNDAYQTLDIKPEQTSSNTSLYIAISLGVISLLGLFMFLSRKSISEKFVKSKINEDNSNCINLSQNTENEILLNLSKFESSQEYLDKNLSMSMLIGRLNTNSKYLRYILKKHKESDYNNYINELRINYIVHKLKTDPEYLNYKISYLADESGFSSHSKFSSNFRQIVGLTPSEFIDNIKKG